MIKISQIKGVIFDLDGTLIDTEYYHWQAWRKQLKNFGISLTKEQFFNYAGKRKDQVERELAINFDLKIKKGELLKQRDELLTKWFNSLELRLMFFATEAIEFFTQRKKYKIAVTSNGSKDKVILKLKKINFYQYFSIITTGSDVERGKPYPDIYLLTVKKLKLKPRECVALEDTQWGVESAKSAGLNCFAIPSEYSKKQDFSKADKIFKNLKEVVSWFKM